VSLLIYSGWFIYKEFKSRRKIPYEKLFETKKKEYLVRNNRFIAWLVVVFFLSIFSIGFLYKITLISLPILFSVLALITIANIFLFRKKYKIKKGDVAFLSLVIGMGQLSLFLWLNFIPVDHHYEAYRIDNREVDEVANLTIIHLEKEKFEEYWSVRTFQSSNAPKGDTIVYHFNDGLIGFKVYLDHKSH
jgi:hypothetical protein